MFLELPFRTKNLYRVLEWVFDTVVVFRPFGARPSSICRRCTTCDLEFESQGVLRVVGDWCLGLSRVCCVRKAESVTRGINMPNLRLLGSTSRKRLFEILLSLFRTKRDSSVYLCAQASATAARRLAPLRRRKRSLLNP